MSALISAFTPPPTLEALEVQLDFNDEQHAIDQLTQQLRLLEDTRKDMETTQTVSRDQIQELVDECDLTLPEQCPINAYTMEPSSTNVTVTIESIWESTKGVLKAILDKVMEILRKIFDWIRRLLDPILPYSKNYVKLRDNLAILLATEEELQRLLPPGPVTISGEEKARFDKLEADLAKQKEEWTHRWNDLVGDVLTDGPYITAMRAVCALADHTFNLVHAKIGILNALVSENHRDPNVPAVQRDILDKLDNVATPVDGTGFSAAAHRISKDHRYNPQDSLSVYTGIFANERMRLEGGKNHSCLDMMQVAHYLIDRRVPYEQLTLPVDDILKAVTTYNREVGSILTARPREDSRGVIAAAYRNAGITLISEFKGLRVLLQQAVQDNMLLQRSMAEISKYVYDRINCTMVQLRAAGDETNIARAEELLKKAKEAFKPF